MLQVTLLTMRFVQIISINWPPPDSMVPPPLSSFTFEPETILQPFRMENQLILPANLPCLFHD